MTGGKIKLNDCNSMTQTCTFVLNRVFKETTSNLSHTSKFLTHLINS